MKSFVMFMEILYRDTLPQFKEKHLEYYSKAIELKETCVSVSNWRSDTYNTLNAYDLRDDALFKDLISDITKEVIFFSKQFGVVSEDIDCTAAWINISEPGNYQEYHLHTNNHFSAVYYLKVPLKSGDIVFRSAACQTDMYPLPIKTIEMANYKTFTVSPEESELLIFRSNLMHMVEKNKSDDTRVSIALNFNIK